jgi:UDP-GlcNAc:undecaprenyl-phosphate/decaprenyl-phosphate GlcNAc-1-phosphate transferase
MHTCPTPRVGGVAIFLAFGTSFWVAPASVTGAYGNFILATGILFSVGLLEDLGFQISPRRRLAAAAIASLAVIGLLGVWLPRVDIPGFDVFMGQWWLGVPMTLLVTVGLANGFNLIDGVNGLASMTAGVAAVALSLIAYQGGYLVMVELALMLAAVVFGFFLMNYPFGLIFLGDAGAYTLGFVLSWFGIAVLLHVPDASPWAILLTMFWPVADTLLAIWRRARRKSDAMAPDRLHVHQMVMRGVEICLLGRKRRRISNPLSTLILAPFVMAPPLVGVLFWNQTVLAFAAVVIFAVLFFVAYWIAPKVIARCRTKSDCTKYDSLTFSTSTSASKMTP